MTEFRPGGSTEARLAAVRERSTQVAQTSATSDSLRPRIGAISLEDLLALLEIEDGLPSPKGRISLEACRTQRQDFLDLVDRVVKRVSKVVDNFDSRALIVRVLLHLPRVAGATGVLTRRQVDAELRRSARQLLKDQENVKHWVPTQELGLDELTFVYGEKSASAQLFDSLHYLRNSRPGAVNYALVDKEGRPVTLCSVSPLEWMRVGKQITRQFAVPMEAVRDVSRVYSFDSAPFNAISFLLSRVRHHIRKTCPEVRLLSTAVDPNLGFTGTSYVAANWQRWMTIKARPYMYFDKYYVTPRQLRTRFETTNVDQLKSTYPGRFQDSSVDLLDSMIFCSRVKGPTESVPLDQQRRLYR
ncbi:hypothetical protein EV649_0080 [Kribbella sp. VKM Ac-2569]|uniref:Mom family adenine methylcarbamoylation protein n=1 Tax=Kribbella sp. VKM Ac-2569 TaxID=2512220 RepID=UPI00102CD20C|nr:hypothetical protein [Kribbella sp. VKM Ac-2569]RZT26337.1 hypothetical protein EV649_0080 [Kribbella sp. VKM Ac-2569]